jgi:hypothetical protein
LACVGVALGVVLGAFFSGEPARPRTRYITQKNRDREAIGCITYDLRPTTHRPGVCFASFFVVGACVMARAVSAFPHFHRLPRAIYSMRRRSWDFPQQAARSVQEIVTAH